MIFIRKGHKINNPTLEKKKKLKKNKSKHDIDIPFLFMEKEKQKKNLLGSEEFAALLFERREIILDFLDSRNKLTWICLKTHV